MAGRIAYYGNIVKDGLVLCLDAAKKDSYPGSGTVWNDISGFGNNGTLTNGPTFNSSNGGSIVFDGTNDYVNTLDIPFRFSPSFTMNIWFYWDGLDKTNNNLISKRNGSPFNQYSFQLNNGNPYAGGTGKVLVFFARDDSGRGVANNALDTVLTYTLPSTPNIYNVSSTMTTSQQRLYINGNIVSSSSVDYTNQTFNITGRNLLIGAGLDNAGTGIIGAVNSRIFAAQLYNKALSASEVLQNYNATKGRYGL